MDDIWATKSEDVGLIVHAISFQDFQPIWSWSTNVTDGQTDRRHVIARPALHRNASRGKKNSWLCPSLSHAFLLRFSSVDWWQISEVRLNMANKEIIMSDSCISNQPKQLDFDPSAMQHVVSPKCLVLIPDAVTMTNSVYITRVT